MYLYIGLICTHVYWYIQLYRIWKETTNSTLFIDLSHLLIYVLLVNQIWLGVKLMINGLKFNVTKYLKLCPTISTYIFIFQSLLWFLENYIPTLFLLFCSIFSCSFIVTWHDKQSIYLVQNIQVIYFYSCQVFLFVTENFEHLNPGPFKVQTLENLLV